MTLDAKTLTHLRSLAAKADPCEWSVESDRGSWSVLTAHGGVVADGLSKETATVIAESKNAMPALLDEIERLRALVKAHAPVEGTTEP